MKNKITLLLALLFSITARAQTVIDLPGLKNIFNSMQGYPRVVFIGDPTCPACIASSGDLKNYVFNQCPNPDLRGLIVWVHMSGYPSILTDAIAQSASWTDARVTCYWDSLWDISYAFGYQGGWAGCNWAWDIAMIYSDTASWPGTYPLAPYYCMSKTGCCNVWNMINFRNQLTALGECSATATHEINSSATSINIFPNPLTTQATISFSKEVHNATFSLYNLLGEKVAEVAGISGESYQFNRGNLRSGVYVFEVREGKNIWRGKAVVY